jgi:hypothetical protein
VKGPHAKSVIPPWVVEEAWRRAWDVGLAEAVVLTEGKLEKAEGIELRRLSLRVREHARQITRGMMDMMYPARPVVATVQRPNLSPEDQPK